MAAHVLDVEHYPNNVKYVEDTEIVERRSPRMSPTSSG